MAVITVATLNLRNRHDRWLQRRHLIVAELLDTQPDLISFQEVYRPIGQARWLRNQVNSRLSGSSSRPYRLYQKRRHHLINGYFEGVAIMSRLPVLSHDFLSLGYGGRVALRANVELPTGETLDFVSLHLHHVAEDREARTEQVMRLAGWLGEHNPVSLQVIAGDFNEVPDGIAISRMKQIYRSCFEEIRGYDPIATFPTAMASRSDGWAGCLDYIFVSRSFAPVLDARIFCQKPSTDDLTLYPSDHVGLLATLEVPTSSSRRSTGREVDEVGDDSSD